MGLRLLMRGRDEKLKLRGGDIGEDFLNLKIMAGGWKMWSKRRSEERFKWPTVKVNGI